MLVGSGVLARLPDVLGSACPAARYALIADAAVAAHYGARVREAAGRVAPCDLFTFPAGEWNKTREQWAALTDALLRAGVGRDGAVVALGGGVSGDLAGFVAATYLRGIPCVQLPTSVVAMIDSSVGGKTGVDAPHGKNLVGAFHQPRAVIADVDTLATLPVPHLVAGLAEAIKHGAIVDAGYFARLGTVRQALLAREAEAWVEIVSRSVELKAAVVAEDEREHGRRAILNFGHTVGHAVEALTRYETLHGEAVAIGMVAEARLGETIGITRSGTAATLNAALETLGLPTGLPVPVRDLLPVMGHDKKTRRGTVRFALLQELGCAARGEGGGWTFEVGPEALEAALRP